MKNDRRLRIDSWRFLRFLCHYRRRPCFFQYTGISVPEKKRICEISVRGPDAGRDSENVLYRSPCYAGKPVLLSLLLTAVFTAFMIKASYLAPMEFITKAPVIPILLFVLTVFVFVALAYFLGGRKILRGGTCGSFER